MGLGLLGRNVPQGEFWSGVSGKNARVYLGGVVRIRYTFARGFTAKKGPAGLFHRAIETGWPSGSGRRWVAGGRTSTEVSQTGCQRTARAWARGERGKDEG